MANSVITLDNVSFRYPDAGRDALSGVSLSIEAGSFIAVLGHNGSGKSTLAKLLNAILVPTEGTVTVKGMDTRSEENLLNVRRTVGMVFQNPDNQIVASVVEDDVAFAPENLGVPPAEIRRRVDEALKRVGMYEFRNNAPHLLSGGQKQRVAIAGVLAILLTLTAMGTALGLFISAKVKNQFLAIELAVVLAYMPSLMLSGFLFDLRSVPVWIEFVGRLLPPTYAVEAFKQCFLAGDGPILWRNVGILCCWAALFFCMAVRVLRKRPPVTVPDKSEPKGGASC